MPSRRFAFLFCLLLASPLFSQANNMKPSTPHRDFDQLAAQFLYDSLALSPVNASQAGYHRHTDPKTGKTVELDAQLDDLGPRGIAAQLAFYRSWHQRFLAIDRHTLSKEQFADLQLISDQIGFSLLELEKIQSYRHDPTTYVELIGNALFLPMTQNYASAEVRMGHVLSRMEQIPRALEQAKQVLSNGDPIKTSTAIEENAGNIDLIQNTVKAAIPSNSPLQARYNIVAPKAVASLQDFSKWLHDVYGPRHSNVTWRLGKTLYAEKFRLIMETPVSPEQMLASAEQQMREVRADMLHIAEPLHKQMYPTHGDHSDLHGEARENLIIWRSALAHLRRSVQTLRATNQIEGDLAGIVEFIRQKKIVDIGSRNNLKVIPTPPFMRGIYSVAGFHAPPPLEPTAEAQFWVTPIDPSTPPERPSPCSANTTTTP